MLVKVRVEQVVTQYAEIEVDVSELEQAGVKALEEAMANPPVWQESVVSGPMFATATPV